MGRTRPKKRERLPAPPRGLVATTVRDGGEAIAIFSFPLSAPTLTLAEHDVAQRLLAGRSNARIARERGTSERTVANQVASILRKMRVRSRSELVASHALFRA